MRPLLLCARACSAAAAAAPLTATAPLAEDATLADVAARNAAWRRQVAQSADGWIRAENIDRSIFAYGMSARPYKLRTLLLRDEGSAPLAHDLISWLGLQTQASAPLEYLEIGVSVLKCVSTLVHAWRGASITAFDVEDPNPTQSDRWGAPSVLATWPLSGLRAAQTFRRPDGKEVHPLSFLSGDQMSHWPATHATHRNSIYYVASDAMNISGWRELARLRLGRRRGLGGGPFNLVLSDGLHTAAALSWEISQMKAGGFLARTADGPLTIMWDDCAGRMYHSVRAAVRPVAAALERSDLCFASFRVPGWAGVNEPLHPTCLLTSLSPAVLARVLPANVSCAPLSSTRAGAKGQSLRTIN